VHFQEGGRSKKGLKFKKSCITLTTNLYFQCVKEGEKVMLIDLKGTINHTNTPAIESLEQYLLENPNFQPVINTNLGK